MRQDHESPQDLLNSAHRGLLLRSTPPKRPVVFQVCIITRARALCVGTWSQTSEPAHRGFVMVTSPKPTRCVCSVHYPCARCCACRHVCVCVCVSRTSQRQPNVFRHYGNTRKRPGVVRGGVTLQVRPRPQAVATQVCVCVCVCVSHTSQRQLNVLTKGCFGHREHARKLSRRRGV
jgi:hypothetical protein